MGNVGALDVYPALVAGQLRAIPWAARELLSGRVRDARLLKTLYRLKGLSARGYYHNIHVSSGYSTYSIGGMRANRPLSDPAASDILWGLISSAIPGGWRGARVVDIGPAEGYFTLAAARAGAQVTAIHPPHYFFTRRLTALAAYFELSPRIRLQIGLYPDAGREAVREAQVVLCLGLLYHLPDIEAALEPFTQSRATVLIEGVFAKDGTPAGPSGWAQGFDPRRHRENDPVCARWLADALARRGFSVSWLDEWQRFVERPGNLRHPHTRRALVAAPASRPTP